MKEAKLLKAESMFEYSESHDFGTGINPKRTVRYFRIIERMLQPGESVMLAFVGLHRFHSLSSHRKNYAYAVTNRRIIMAKMRIFDRPIVEQYPLNHIYNIGFQTDDAVGVMQIDLGSEVIGVGFAQETAVALSEKFTQLLPIIQEKAAALEAEEHPEAASSAEEEAE